jgi:hypothetical protein
MERDVPKRKIRGAKHDATERDALTRKAKLTEQEQEHAQKDRYAHVTHDDAPDEEISSADEISTEPANHDDANGNGEVRVGTRRPTKSQREDPNTVLPN